MKKIMTLFLILLMTLCFTACNAADKDKTDTTKNEPETDTTAEEDDDEITQEKYDSMTEEDLLAYIEDINNITTDEYIWLVSTYRFVLIDEDTLTIDNTNITDGALYSISYEAKPEPDTYMETLLESPYPQVRHYAVSCVHLGDDNIPKCIEMIETETDNYVLLELTSSLPVLAGEDKKVGEFLLKMADDENAALRKAAAIGLTRTIGLDGAVEKVIELINDEDKDVRRNACLYCTDLKDARVIEPLKAILDNPDEEDLHSECMQALVKFWYDYPYFESTNAEAYQITMDYLRKVPRTEYRPGRLDIGVLANDRIMDKYNAWKEKATYFDTNELFDVMVDILKDENANEYLREHTMSIIYAHTPERINELQPIVDGLTDEQAESLRSAYAEIIAE